MGGGRLLPPLPWRPRLPRASFIWRQVGVSFCVVLAPHFSVEQGHGIAGKGEGRCQRTAHLVDARCWISLNGVQVAVQLSVRTWRDARRGKRRKRQRHTLHRRARRAGEARARAMVLVTDWSRDGDGDRTVTPARICLGMGGGACAPSSRSTASLDC